MSRERVIADEVLLSGVKTVVNAVTIYCLIRDAERNILIATGMSVPTDTSSGFAKGCLFVDTDVASGTGGLYCNKGTKTSCAFTLVSQA